ncbi:RAF protein, partial [Aphelenchoides avenae]
CFGNCRHDLGNRISPPFVFDRISSTLFYARNGVMQAVQMTCRSIHPKCVEEAWQTMMSDGCAWCAQNDSSYAIHVSDTSLCDGGMVVRDVCPPSITNVEVNGTRYLIRGHYFDNFLKHEFYSEPTKVTIDICDVPCDYEIRDFQGTSYAAAAALVIVMVMVAMLVSLIYGRCRQVRARREWEIPYKQLHIEQKIGQGMYGVVFRAYRYGPVAVKQLYMAHPSPSVRRSLENEIRLLKSLRHSNVLSLLGVVTRPQLAIVTDWCYCSLYHKLHVAEAKYDEETQLRICSQIAEGMNYLHSKAVLH